MRTLVVVGSALVLSACGSHAAAPTNTASQTTTAAPAAVTAAAAVAPTGLPCLDSLRGGAPATAPPIRTRPTSTRTLLDNGPFGTIAGPAFKLTVAPSSVAAGDSATGTVTLSDPAPEGGTTIELSSDSSVVGVPQTVVIPAGKTTATFPVTTSGDAATTTVTITGSSGGATGSAPLTVRERPKETTTSPPPTPTQPPGKTGPAGQTSGDPHLWTMDGLAYDFQAVGEFVLVKADSGKYLELQVREQPFLGSRTIAINTAVAMNVAGDRLSLYDDLRARTVTALVRVNGQGAELRDGVVRLPHGGLLSRCSNDYSVLWPDKTAVDLEVASYGVSVMFSPAVALEHHLVGLLGNYDGTSGDDLTTATGARIKAAGPSDVAFFKQLHQVYGNSWRISQHESLFDYGPGRTTKSYTDLTFPDRPVTQDSLTASERADARHVCINAGVTTEPFLANCILDVGETHVDAFATAARVSQRVSKPAAASQPVTTSISPSDTLVVHVVEAAGTPAQATVHVFSGTQEVTPGYGQGTDANGNAVFALKAGRYRIRADESNSSPTATVDVREGSTRTVDLDTQVGSLVVHVQRAPGAPSHATVHIFSGVTEVTPGYGQGTDANGDAAFKLRAGPYRVRADESNSSPAGVVDIHPAATAHLRLVTRVGTLTVHVLRASGAPAQATVHVFLGTQEVTPGYGQGTDANGNATFVLEAGRYRIRADESNSSPSGSVEVKPAASARLELSTHVGTLIVHVQRAPGTPSEATVHVFSGTKEITPGYGQGTDAHGDATFALEAGRYTVRADESNSSPAGKVTVTAGAASHLQLTTHVGSLTVHAQRGPGIPSQATVHVFLGTTEITPGYGQGTDAHGDATFALKEGRYTIRADESNSSPSGTVDVHPAKAARIQLTTEVGALIVDTGHAAIVHVFSGTTEITPGYGQATDAQGRATFALKAGRYRVTAGDGKKSGSADASVGAGRTATVEVRLR